jgi:hypothetical protein
VEKKSAPPLIPSQEAAKKANDLQVDSLFQDHGTAVLILHRFIKWKVAKKATHLQVEARKRTKTPSTTFMRTG